MVYLHRTIEELFLKINKHFPVLLIKRHKQVVKTIRSRKIKFKIGSDGVICCIDTFVPIKEQVYGISVTFI